MQLAPTPMASEVHQPNGKGVGILARTLFRQMREQGYSPEQIIGLSSALIELVREDLCRDSLASHQ